MNQAVPRETTAHSEFAEPRMVHIPEGWFLMGSGNGQDNERPVHRVWVDAFLLAECQVTHAEFEAFLAATALQPPLQFNDGDFSHPAQPVVGVSWFDAT